MKRWHRPLLCIWDRNTPCAVVEQTGKVSGKSECDKFTIIAESSTGPMDGYPLIVENQPDATKKSINKTR